VFDAGRGNLQRLLQAKVPLNEIHALFLTHLHSDHVVGIPDMLLTGWLFGRSEAPFRVWGLRGKTENSALSYFNKARRSGRCAIYVPSASISAFS
jgi:ribonuclease BN (tRNA processing enzyme)